MWREGGSSVGWRVEMKEYLVRQMEVCMGELVGVWE